MPEVAARGRGIFSLAEPVKSGTEIVWKKRSPSELLQHYVQFARQRFTGQE